MTQILYIDVLFLVNWMMDVVLLWLAGRLWRRRICLWRIGVSAAAGAVWSCLYTILGGQQSWLRLPGMILTAWLMIRLAYPGRQVREWLRGILCLSVAALVLGGWCHGIYEGTWLGRFWYLWMSGTEAEAMSVWLLAVAMLTGMAAISLGLWYGKASANRQQIQEVTLRHQGKQISVMALWDSGNHLQDPYTGKGVHILQRQTMDVLWNKKDRLPGEHEEQEFQRDGLGKTESQPMVQLIPFRSLGGSHTLLPVVTLDQLVLADGTILDHPRIGISDQPLFEDQKAQMLLHAQTDEMRRKPIYGH